MSTFVQRLWDKARNRERGFDKNIAVVNRADLIQLLENFERLDNEARQRHAVSEMQYQQLKQASELQIKIPSYTLDDIRSLSEIRNRPKAAPL